MSPAATASSIQPATTVATPPQRKDSAAAADVFKSQLAAAGAVKNAAEDVTLRREAQRLVSQVFFGTLLKQMRNSPFKSELWSGGRGGEAFGGLYDQHLADRMAKASGKKLVNSIVKSLRRDRARKSGGAAADVVQMDLRG
jgi:Rod binding domain-containing protein